MRIAKTGDDGVLYNVARGVEEDIGKLLESLESSLTGVDLRLLDLENVNTSAGGVGTYAFLGNTIQTVYNPGDLIAGSSLEYGSAIAYNASSSTTTTLDNDLSGTNPAGTWQCMGYMHSDINNWQHVTLWLRVS